MKKVLAVTVTGKDRPGIISSLTGAIFQTGGNLEDASMTILEGEFAMILLACFKDARACLRICRKLNTLEQAKKLAITVKELKRQLVRGRRQAPGTGPCVISVFGKDRAGIVHRVSKLLASHGVNITDLDSRIIGSGRSAGYALILEADVPKDERSRSYLLKDFKDLQRALRVTIALRPLETTGL